MENKEQIGIRRKRKSEITEHDRRTFYFILGMSLAAIVYCITFSIFFMYLNAI